jgi:hypothetical protein
MFTHHQTSGLTTSDFMSPSILWETCCLIYLQLTVMADQEGMEGLRYLVNIPVWLIRVQQLHKTCESLLNPIIWLIQYHQNTKPFLIYSFIFIIKKSQFRLIQYNCVYNTYFRLLKAIFRPPFTIDLIFFFGKTIFCLKMDQFKFNTFVDIPVYIVIRIHVRMKRNFFFSLES